MDVFICSEYSDVFSFCCETVESSSIKKCSQAAKFNINTVLEGESVLLLYPVQMDGDAWFWGLCHSHCTVVGYSFHRKSFIFRSIKLPAYQSTIKPPFVHITFRPKPVQMLIHWLSLAHLHNLCDKFPLPNEICVCAHSYLN